MLGKKQRDKFKILILISLTRDDQNVVFTVWKSVGNNISSLLPQIFLSHKGAWGTMMSTWIQLWILRWSLHLTATHFTKMLFTHAFCQCI